MAPRHYAKRGRARSTNTYTCRHYEVWRTQPQQQYNIPTTGQCRGWHEHKINTSVELGERAKTQLLPDRDGAHLKTRQAAGANGKAQA